MLGEQDREIVLTTDLDAAADHIASLSRDSSYFGRNRVILDKRGGVDDPLFVTILKTLEDRSKAGEYTDHETGRQVLFFPFSTHIDRWIHIQDTDENLFWRKLAEFTSEIPQLADHFQDFATHSKAFWIPKLPQNPTNVDYALYTFSYLRDPNWTHSQQHPGLNMRDIRKVLGSLGNPRDNDSRNWPLIVPLLDIEYPDVPPTVLEILHDFDARYQPLATAFFEGKKKRSDYFTPEELLLARRCQAIVMTVEAVCYDSYTVAGTHDSMTRSILATPLFPYDALARRNRYYHEGWLNFGPNDDLVELLQSYHPIKI